MSAVETSQEEPSRRARPFVALVAAIDSVFPRVKPSVQRALIHRGYQYLNNRLAHLDTGCLNYGFAPVESSPWTPGSDVGDGPDRYGVQLYDRVMARADVVAKDVLEVGCGRGGGAAFVAQNYRPRSMTGLDFSSRAIAWCRSRHSFEGLRFVEGDAEDLPFNNASFDAVLSVESSHCYPHFDDFLREAHRVLRQDGLFMFADIRPAAEVDRLRNEVAGAGFDVLEDQLITSNVVRALELDAVRRQTAVATAVPRLLRPAMADFVAVPGSETFRWLRSESLQYVRLLARRAPAPEDREWQG